MSNPFSEAFSDLRKPYLAEELPARKFKPTSAPKAEGGDEKKGSAEGNSEKKIRQAVYDIRYRARREDIPLESAFSQYMANTSMSDVEKKAVRAKLFGGGETKAESANPFTDAFAELRAPYLGEEIKDTKYQVRVTDKNGKSYVRMADRTKIGELRANPNISSVEMTNYGTPYEGERKKGTQTAAVKAGKTLDPVGREDKDIDNDGDHDKSDKYLLNRRKAIGKAIGSRMKESLEINDSIKNIAEIMGSSSNNPKVNPKKGIKNEVVVNPELGESVIAYEESEIESMSEFQEAMTAAQKAKREDIVKGMKKNFGDMKSRYGARATDVMYATATKQALKASYDPEAVDEGAGKLAAGLAGGIAAGGMYLAGKAKEAAKKMREKKEKELKLESYALEESSDESDFEEKREALREKIADAKAKGDKKLLAKLRGDLQALERTAKYKRDIEKSGVGEDEFVRRREKGLKTRFMKGYKARYGHLMSNVDESIEEAAMILQLKKASAEGPCDCCGKTPCDCEDESPKKVEDDPRMARNKARAMGLKMSFEPQGDLVDESSCGASHKKPKQTQTKKPTNEEVEQIDEVLGRLAGKVAGKVAKAGMKWVDKQVAKSAAKAAATPLRRGPAKVTYKPSSKPSTVKYGGGSSTTKPAEAPKRLASVKDVADDPWSKGAISRDDVMRARADMRAARGK